MLVAGFSRVGALKKHASLVFSVNVTLLEDPFDNHVHPGYLGLESGYGTAKHPLFSFLQCFIH